VRLVIIGLSLLMLLVVVLEFAWLVRCLQRYCEIFLGLMRTARLRRRRRPFEFTAMLGLFNRCVYALLEVLALPITTVALNATIRTCG
jgi:hypothetical protein